MELRHLRYFVAVADELHFRRAADQINIVQPALSKQIALLEKELGVQLFERTKRQVRLTEAGAVFLDEARQVLASAEQASERARGAGRGESGVLGIGFIAPAIYTVLPRVLRRYRSGYPNVRLTLHEMTNRSALQEVLAGRLHVAFVRLPIEDNGLRRALVLDEPVMLALPDTHPLTERTEIALGDVADDSFVMIPRSREPELYDYYIALCLDAGFSPRVVRGRPYSGCGRAGGGQGGSGLRSGLFHHGVVSRRCLPYAERPGSPLAHGCRVAPGGAVSGTGRIHRGAPLAHRRHGTPARERARSAHLAVRAPLTRPLCCRSCSRLAHRRRRCGAPRTRTNTHRPLAGRLLPVGTDARRVPPRESTDCSEAVPRAVSAGNSVTQQLH